MNEWMNDPSSNPDLVPLGNGRYKMTVENFRKALTDTRLVGTASGGAEPDFVIRPDVKGIELVARRPDVFEVLLPEPGMMQEYGEALQIPSIYGLVDFSSATPRGGPSATHAVRAEISGLPFLRGFLGPL